MALSQEWKDKVSDKIFRLFGDVPDTVTRILWKLTQKDSEPTWETLKLLYHQDDLFELFVKRIAGEEATKETFPLTVSEQCQQKEHHCEDTNGAELMESELYAVKAQQSIDPSRVNNSGLQEVVPAVDVVTPVDEVINMALPQESKDKIIQKLVSIFHDEPDLLEDILWSLANDNIASNWQMLKSLFNSDHGFKVYANRIAHEARKIKQMFAHPEDAPRAYQVVAVELKNALQQSEHEFGNSEHLAVLNRINYEFVQEKLRFSMPSFNAKDCVMYIAAFKLTVASMDDIAGILVKSSNISMVGLAAVFLSINAVINIRKYWKGEISGKRCCKNILDFTFTLASGIAGTVGGALIGSLAGPVGTVVGGFVGGFLSAHAAQELSDRLTRNIFGVHKYIALDNAYNYFGLKLSASNSEINKAYHRMCLKHHPDKGGKKEDFFIVQVHMSVIKLSKGYEEI